MSQHVVFAGTPDFAVPSLQALIDNSSFVVDLVITQPDKPVGRKQVLTPPPVKVKAEKHNLPVWQPANINREFADSTHNTLTPDFLVVVAYGQILKQEILDWPSIAPVNVHASLLPRWRGASPIQHAILAGDATTGVTVQQMVAALDAGPILSQQEVELSEQTTAPELHDTLAATGAALLTSTLTKPLQPKAQDEKSVIVCKKLTRQHGQVDPEQVTATEIDRAVRALVPWPGVTCALHNETVKLLRTSLSDQSDALPLTCKDDSMLYVLDLQPPGKRPMSAAAWQRGHKN